MTTQDYYNLVTDKNGWKTLPNGVCLEVEIKREDICFGGLPGNDMKLRVKKIKVLRILTK
jgi:hypothetical protein